MSRYSVQGLICKSLHKTLRFSGSLRPAFATATLLENSEPAEVADNNGGKLRGSFPRYPHRMSNITNTDDHTSSCRTKQFALDLCLLHSGEVPSPILSELLQPRLDAQQVKPLGSATFLSISFESALPSALLLFVACFVSLCQSKAAMRLEGKVSCGPSSLLKILEENNFLMLIHRIKQSIANSASWIDLSHICSV